MPAISFEPVSHTYTVDGDSSFTSVTTLLAKWFTPFDADAVIRRFTPATRARYAGMSPDAIKAQWRDSGATASRLGTQLHEHIETYLKGEVVDDTSPEFGYFLAFRDAVNLVPFHLEWRLCHVPGKLIGTIDCATKNDDGSVNLYDWKRSNKLSTSSFGRMSIHPALTHIPDTSYWKYVLQLNLYRYLAEKNGFKVRHMFVVGFHPDQPTYQKLQVELIDVEKILDPVSTPTPCGESYSGSSPGS